MEVGEVFFALLSNWEHPTAHPHTLPAGEIKRDRERKRERGN
jgi:hypothetical protein